MTTAAAKSKGRRLQQTMRDALLAIGAKFGLEPGDIRSTPMGVSGPDLMTSPAASRLFGPLTVECKNCESLNVTSIFWTHAKKYPEDIPVLVHKRNHTEPLVTVKLSYFIELLNRSIVNAQ